MDERTQSLDDPEQAVYIAALRSLFLAPACVTAVFSAANQKLAAEWYRTGVPLDDIERAILLGCARKYMALFNHQGGSPITSLQYFAGPLQEVAETGMSLDYWRYLASRVRKWQRSGALTQTLRRQHRQPKQKRHNVAASSPFFLTHDDHFLHNALASVCRRRSDRLQFGTDDFLRRNPHLSVSSTSCWNPNFSSIVATLTAHRRLSG